MKTDLIPRAFGNNKGDPKEWAQRLRQREQQLDRLTKAQRDMWRSALGWTEHQKEAA